MSVDVGGTFTDTAVRDSTGTLRAYKAESQVEDPAAGVLDSLHLAAADLAGGNLQRLLEQVQFFVHSTTIALNAVLQGRTGRTALLVTDGFRDVLLLREGGKRRPYDLTMEYPDPYVPRALTFEVAERVTPEGAIEWPLDVQRLDGTISELERVDVEAVAVCLLWSVVEPAHELEVGRRLSAALPNTPISLSHQVNPVIREYRRASATAIDASLKPVVSRYLVDLEHRLKDLGLSVPIYIGTSAGGIVPLATSASAPITLLRSGPALAPVGGRRYAVQEEFAADLIVADTGGTSFDVSLVRGGEVPLRAEIWLGEEYSSHMTGLPAVDVRSVGAGGGSVAWVDAAGLLHVGPRSAGAHPGPACYGKGGEEPTVTDAALVLGMLDPDRFLGGRKPLRKELAERSVLGLAEVLETEPDLAALGILQLATAHMVGAIEEITVEQGIDTSELTLVAGGGAGGFNAVEVARALGCKRVLVPSAMSALSAAGGVFSDHVADFRETCYTNTAAFDRDLINATLRRLRQRGEAFFETLGAHSGRRRIDLYATARYAFQLWEIDVPLPQDEFPDGASVDRFVNAFHRTHERLFAVSEPGQMVECVGWRAHAVNELAIPGGHPPKPGSEPIERHRPLFLDGQWRDIPALDIDSLAGGHRGVGPAVLEGSVTTVVLPPNASFAVTESRNLVLTPGEGHPDSEHTRHERQTVS